MESEKVKEIKKALECCTNNKGCEPCQRLSKKPYHLDDCRFVLLTDTLTLINELESENERLKEEKDLYKKQFNELEPRFFDLREENQQLKDRIADLEKENGELKQHITEVDKGIINIARERNKKEELASKFIDSYNDSLKQFSERVKGKFEHCVGDIYHADTIDEKIDATLKEFLGEKK